MQDQIYNPNNHNEEDNPLPVHKPMVRYYDGNPQEGGKEVSDSYDILQQSGILEQDRKAGLPPINPVHDFELLKGVRESEYNKAAKALHAEYVHSGKAPTQRDFQYHRRDWLQDEITRNIDGWIAKNQQSRIKRPKHLVELNKYRDYVLEQIRQVEQLLAQPEIDNSQPLKSATIMRRGKYKNADRDRAIELFATLLRNAIAEVVRKGRTLNEQAIIDKVYKQVAEKVNDRGKPLYNERTLRGYLPKQKKEQLLGEIHRQVLIQFGLFNS